MEFWYDYDISVGTLGIVSYENLTNYIGIYAEEEDAILYCDNFDLSGDINDNFTLELGDDPCTISQSSGVVSLENTILYNLTAIGGATFNAFLTNGNVDNGDNYGWNWIDNTSLFIPRIIIIN